MVCCSGECGGENSGKKGQGGVGLGVRTSITRAHPPDFISNYLLNSWRMLLLLWLFFTFSVLVANPKKLLNKVANPARGLLNREKRTKETSGSGTPFPPTSHKLKSRDASTGATQVSFHLAPVQGFLRLVDQVKGCRFANFYASVCDDIFLVSELGSSTSDV